MSWLDLVQRDFIITTGEGSKFKVNWLNATKLVEYNVAMFEFPGLAGTLVNRGTPKGRRYNIEIFFQGEDNIDQAFTFEAAAADPRPWNISHPLYANIIVQPIGLEFDNSQMNVSRITGQVIETITEDSPITTVDAIDNIQLSKSNLDNSFASTVTAPISGSDIDTLSKDNSDLYKLTVPIIKIPAEVQNYFQLFNVANSAITNAIDSPIFAMQAIQAMINAPAAFTTNVKSRLSNLSSTFQTLRNKLSSSPVSLPVASKQIYQVQGAANISSQLVAASTPMQGDYSNMTDVVITIEILINNYNIYINDLNNMQTSTGGDPDSYIPDAGSVIAMNMLLNSVLGGLFSIALNARQERSVILEKDYNIIVLTHRLYGLDPFDNNIQELFINNNLGINDILVLKKGRKIVYYI